ncbi:baculoviral IAP repeat-containing protein 7-like [Elysia marginata]|uniref:Baculoviral IAP repeat-containing protein 7-like n=1 Tax=Elysia marginata TaxID=1093978 RepID=A0AAV4GGS6_9GAST|nr:baculoviral IAP repeat-containing protein 7-like [Elysia marginata]
MLLYLNGTLVLYYYLLLLVVVAAVVVNIKCCVKSKVKASRPSPCYDCSESTNDALIHWDVNKKCNKKGFCFVSEVYFTVEKSYALEDSIQRKNVNCHKSRKMTNDETKINVKDEIIKLCSVESSKTGKKPKEPGCVTHSVRNPKEFQTTPNRTNFAHLKGEIEILNESKSQEKTHDISRLELNDSKQSKSTCTKIEKSTHEFGSVPVLESVTDAQPSGQQNEILMPVQLKGGAEETEEVPQEVSIEVCTHQINNSQLSKYTYTELEKSTCEVFSVPVLEVSSTDSQPPSHKNEDLVPIQLENVTEETEEVPGEVSSEEQVRDVMAAPATLVKPTMVEKLTTSSATCYIQRRNFSRDDWLVPTKRTYKAHRKQLNHSVQSSIVTVPSDLAIGEVENRAKESGREAEREENNGEAAENKLVMVEAALQSHAGLKPYDMCKDSFVPTTREYMISRRRQRSQISAVLSPIWRHKGTAVNFMKYELLRLCSFIREKNTGSNSQCFIRLAQCGFYSVGGTGMIRCYSCAREYQTGMLDGLSEIAHDQNCNWKETNITLMNSFSRLSNNELEKYLKDYGWGWRYVALDAEHITENEESSLFSSNFGFAEMSEGGEGEEDNCGSDPISSRSRSPLPSGLMNSSSADYMFGGHRRSLPDNLNAVSGSIVKEETVQPAEAAQVILTSASKRPIPQPTAEGASSAEAQVPLARFDLSKASYPQFASSYSRSQTYGTWSRDHPKRPEHLARAGFFYAGYADCVRCFFCGLGLKYWRPEDIPEYQHARFRPNCVYNRMHMGQEYIDRVQEDRGGGPTASYHLGGQQAGQQADLNQQGPQNPHTVQATVPNTVGNAENAQMNNSVTTGDEISPHLNGSLATSAMAKGYSRQQVNEALIYITTHLGDANLSSDALEGYLTQFSENRTPLSADSGIENSISVTGTDSSMATAQSMAGSEAGTASDPSTSHAQYNTSEDGQGAIAQATVLPDQLNPEESIRMRQQLAEVENSLLNQRVLCHVCMAKPVACVYMPCGHVVACKSCADVANNCVICGRVIVATANIFLS